MGKSDKDTLTVFQCAVYLLLMMVAVTVGVATGFSVAYAIKDCDDDDDGANGQKPEPPVRFVHTHTPGPCELVDGVETGAEDMVALPSGLAILSSGLTSFLPRDRPDLLSRTGSLKLFDFNDAGSGATVIPVTNQDSFDYDHFNPHGLSFWKDPGSGRVVVFVINHNYIPDQVETMEKFVFDETSRELTHVESISDDENMLLMNNVVTTSEDTFYYTNFVSSRDPEESGKQRARAAPEGSVGYYNGSHARILVRGLRLANGVNISPDGQFLYVAESGRNMFRTFQVNDDHSITPYKEYDIHTAPDNLDVDGNYVWVAGHVSLAQTGRYGKEPNKVTSPSQVLRLKVENGEMTEMIEVFADNGEYFSAATVAVTHGQSMLMGSLYTMAMSCQLTYIP